MKNDSVKVTSFFWQATAGFDIYMFLLPVGLICRYRLISVHMQMREMYAYLGIFKNQLISNT